MTVAHLPDKTSPLRHSSAIGASQEGGVPGAPAALTTTRDTAPSATEVATFSTVRDDPRRPIPPGLVYYWHLNAFFVSQAKLKALFSNRLEVRRFPAVCSGSNAVSVRRFREYMGILLCCVEPKGLHCNVQFVFVKAEVRYLDLTPRMPFLGSRKRMRQPSALTLLPRWGFFPRDSYLARAKLTACSPRRGFSRIFGPRVDALVRAGNDAACVKSKSMLDCNVTLHMIAPIPLAVISADAPHVLAVPASPAVQYFGTLPLNREGYTEAMFERLVTFEWIWQIGEATLHEAVLYGRVWLIESEITRKRVQELWPTFPSRELLEHRHTFDASLRHWTYLAHLLASAFEQAPS